MFDVTAIGELLIDFIPSGLSKSGNQLFERNPGGAPANVVSAVAKLGGSSAFLGMVGYDNFGVFLKTVLKESGVDTSGLKESRDVNTTLAFVHLDSKGDRSFGFYRNPGADMMMSDDDIDFEIIKKSRIFHYGSISMTNEPAFSATLKAVSFAKENGLILSYDPNLRPSLWKDLNDARKKILIGLKYADVLKISEDELYFITETSNLEEGSQILYDMGISIVFITLGEKGCYYKYKGGNGEVGGYKVKVVDTTGAGDGFLGGVLYKLCKMKLDEIGCMVKTQFEEIVDFGNILGAVVVTKKGAIPAMPSMNDLLSFKNKYIENKF
jgi:fructokinase